MNLRIIIPQPPPKKAKDLLEDYLKKKYGEEPKLTEEEWEAQKWRWH